jgi:hypothetical protein
MRRAVAGALGAAVLTVTGCAIGSDSKQEVHDVVKTFVEARTAGDAAKACATFTAGERRDLLAKATGNTSIRSATDADCRSVILKPDPQSRDRSPDVLAFRERGYEMDIRLAGGGNVAVAYPKGLGHPSFEAIKEDGHWKIDGLAYEKQDYVARCASKNDKKLCACVFDQLRSAGYNTIELIAQATRGATDAQRAAVTACGGEA